MFFTSPYFLCSQNPFPRPVSSHFFLLQTPLRTLSPFVPFDIVVIALYANSNEYTKREYRYICY